VSTVDIDRFIAHNGPAWARLQELARRADRNPRSLSGPELDELVQLYQRASAQLSHARSYYADPSLTDQLTRVVAEGSSAIYGNRPRSWRSLVDFFGSTFPAAIWANGRFVALASALLFVPALVTLVWLTQSPEALATTGSPEQRAVYAEEQFEAYYSDSPSAEFATFVGINNTWVSFLAFSGGAAAMVPGMVILVANGQAIGQAGAWMTTEGEATTFWTLIAPHGLLELSSIVLAAAAGLRLGWTLLVPGDDRTRAEALGQEGRRAGAMILGLVACFGVAALVEGFVTGSGLPIEVKVGIGVLIWVAFVGYVVVLGQEAHRSGYTGLLGERDRNPGDRRPDGAPAATGPTASLSP
jgi:uncharacterized membrane protein SpoIIM required for sporulation